MKLKSASSNPRFKNSTLCVLSSKPRVTSTNSRVTSSNLRVMSSILPVTSSNLLVTNVNSRVTSSNPQFKNHLINENSRKQPENFLIS